MICPHCGFDNLPGSEECKKCSTALSQLDVPIPGNRVERSLMEDHVSVLEPRLPVTVLPTDTVRHAVELMLARDIGSLLVVDEDGKLLGIFSERDLLTKVVDGEHYNIDLPVVDFMTANPEKVTRAHTLDHALRTMDTGGYRHLPVVEDEKSLQPLGMISVRDMLRHITRLCKDR